MISDINLNPAAGEDDIVNVFIVYKLNQATSSRPDNRSNGLFGHDNGSNDKFVCFTVNNQLDIAGTNGAAFTCFSNFPNRSDPTSLKSLF